MNLTDQNEQAKIKRREQRFRNKEQQTSARYLKRLMELSGTANGMMPFFETLKRIYIDLEGVPVPAGVKKIGTYCVMAPQELIYAAGAQPVKLCSGNYTAFSIGDDLVPRDACPLVKAVAGFQEMGVMPLYGQCSMMVVPVTCDCKKKLAGLLKNTWDVCALHVPAEREDEDIEDFILQLYDFLSRLETVTGKRVTYESLSEGMRKVALAQYAFSEFTRIKHRTPYLLRGSHTMAIMNAAAYMPADQWAHALDNLNRELRMREKEGRLVTGKKLPRILLTGSPIVFPNMKIPLLIEEMGGLVSADETCLGERGMWDPAIPVDDSFDGMIRALANRSLRPCPCPTFGNNSQRIYRLRQLVKDNRIDGVIYHVLRGCVVYDYEYKRIEEELGRHDIPVIRLESDYNEEDVEQLRIRIEAFIELINLRREPVRRTKVRTSF